MFTIALITIAFFIGRQLGRQPINLQALATASPQELGDRLKAAVLNAAAFICRLYTAGVTTRQWLSATLDDVSTQLQPVITTAQTALAVGLQLAQAVPARLQR